MRNTIDSSSSGDTSASTWAVPARSSCVARSATCASPPRRASVRANKLEMRSASTSARDLSVAARFVSSVSTSSPAATFAASSSWAAPAPPIFSTRCSYAARRRMRLMLSASSRNVDTNAPMDSNLLPKVAVVLLACSFTRSSTSDSSKSSTSHPPALEPPDMSAATTASSTWPPARPSTMSAMASRSSSSSASSSESASNTVSSAPGPRGFTMLEPLAKEARAVLATSSLASAGLAPLSATCTISVF